MYHDDGTAEIIGGDDNAGYAIDPVLNPAYGNMYPSYHVSSNQRMLLQQQQQQMQLSSAGNHYSQPQQQQQQQRKFKRNFKITGTPVGLNVPSEIPQSLGKEITKDSLENNSATTRPDSRWIRCGDKLKKVPINAIAEVEVSSTDEKEKTFTVLSSSTSHQDVPSRMLTELYLDDDKAKSIGGDHHDTFATVGSALQYTSNGNDYGLGNYGTRTGSGTIFDPAVAPTFDTPMYSSPFHSPNSHNLQQQQQQHFQQQQHLQQQQQQQHLQQQLQQQQQQQQQYGITDNAINLLDNYISQPQQQAQQIQQQQQQYGITDNSINLLDNFLSQPQQQQQQQQRLSPTRPGFFNDGGVGYSPYNDDGPLKQSFLAPQHGGGGVLSQLGAWPSAMPPSPSSMSTICPPLLYVPQDEGSQRHAGHAENNLLSSGVHDNLLLGHAYPLHPESLPPDQIFQDPLPSVHLVDSLPPLPSSPTRDLGSVDLPALVLADDRGYCDALLSSSSGVTTTSEEILGETLHEVSIYDSILADDETSPAPTPVIPEEYLCSLTKQLMIDPVICADGATYEKAVIEKWIANLQKMNAKLISPTTGEEMSHPHLVPNFSIKLLITSFHETSCR